MSDTKYQLVVCIVNAGFSTTVMAAAKEAGARGGTVVRARGTADPEAQEFFDIVIQPDKEMLLIAVPEQIKDAVLQAVYKDCGLGTDGNGIVFSLPVDRAVGLS